jgi:hypothetical protein
MDYERIYNKLIAQAANTPPTQSTETHHIVPRSCGGTDDPSNLVALTVKQHYIAHLLLAKMYRQEHPDLIFAIQLFFHPKRKTRITHRKTWPNWVRRHCSYRQHQLWRQSKRSFWLNTTK